ncbi:peptidoglycan-binding protein [Streptomyces sp. NPDC058375]|uniref:peptidoglycan-binding protein n=1 Tax=Streptomyces sp. NPDC058375 TaxID=3346467 RepID=UPI003663A181
MTAGTDAAHRGRRPRTRTLVSVCVAALLMSGAAGALVWNRDGGGSARTQPEPSAQTATVTRGDLSNSQILDGTLGFGVPATVRAAGDGGTVTWLAPNGTTVTRGKALYRVDDRPVPVLYGDLPLYRRLATPNTVGRDVRVLADNLRDLGYSIGSQPSPGQTVLVQPEPAGDTTGPAGDPPEDPPPGDPAAEGPAAEQTRTAEPEAGRSPTASASPGHASAAPVRVTVRQGDAVLTQALINAVKRWQTALGVPADGVIEVSDTAVLPRSVRVDSAQIQVGQPAEGPLLRVTPTGKAVTIPVDADEAGPIKRGDRVRVRLPDGTDLRGKVASIANSAESPQGEPGDGQTPQVDVIVTLDEPARAKKFDSTPVQAEFVHETRRNVLTVPATALLALREGGYAVQYADGRLAPVTTGLFAKGQVEITGEGITEGDRVVVAS